jgi:site-specific DNA-cytosine methylase
MSRALSARDFVRISQAAEILGASEQTLRNWDRAGKLQAYRHPVNGYRLYRVADLEAVLRELRTRRRNGAVSTRSSPSDTLRAAEGDDLPGSHWSPSVALDPKHRPQAWDAPATTVRRDWRKYPQEAHVLSGDGKAYRRLTPEEIGLLQSIDPVVLSGVPLTDRQKIAAVGDGVPPGFSSVLATTLRAVHEFANATSVEICAGVGGLAEGVAAAGLEHLALVEVSEVCGHLLRNHRPWPAEAVHIQDVRTFDFSPFVGQVGLLAGGPPCQPWSRSGQGRGRSDERDLLGNLPGLLQVIRPEVFLFENVPGLLANVHRSYLSDLVERLRHPADGLSYGVMVGSFDAADFGVPQRRERVIFVGFRGMSSVQASAYLDAVASRRTHGKRADLSTQARPWRTIGEVLAERPDPGGWRRWLSY